MVTAFRPGQGSPSGRGERPEEVLGHACELVRLCGRDAAVAVVLLALVLVGAATRLGGGARPGPAALALLPLVGGPYAASLGCVLRSRRTMRRALGEARGRTGGAVDPGVPWTPFGAAAVLDARVRDGELRRLLAAAHRCGELSWQAVAWAVTASVLFLFWTVGTAVAGAGG